MDRPPESARRLKLRRGCVVIAALASLWAFAVAVTGGWIIDVGGFHFTSHAPRNPFLLSVLAAAAAWGLSRHNERQMSLAADVQWLSVAITNAIPAVISNRAAVIRNRATPKALAGLTAAMTVVVGSVYGADIVVGADSYGYVSQADLWANGTLTLPQPLLDDLPPGVAQEALVPLGYRLNADRSGLVPVYAPGLPMLMAVFERIGGRHAVYYVVPILAGVAIWVTYLLGRSLIGERGGSLAAFFLATSPAFMLQLLYPPMSDIAATAWWTLTLLLVWRAGRVPAFAAGLAACAAILTRPNLLPLALVPGAVVLLGLRSRTNRSLAVQRLLLCTAPIVVGCFVVAYMNAYWYGSPLASGYGRLGGQLFRWQYFWPDLANYVTWTFDSQGPFTLLAAVGLFAVWRAVRSKPEWPIFASCLAVGLIVYACYAFYLPLDSWWSLRFLFPAFPIFFILTAAGLYVLADRLPEFWRGLGVALLVGAMTTHSMDFARGQGAFKSNLLQRFETVGRYVNDQLPPRAAVFTMVHSGSLRYYSGRLTLRYDLIAPEHFDAMVAHLRERGYTPFAVVDEQEEADFTQHFSDRTVVKSLMTQQMKFPGVTVYELSD